MDDILPGETKRKNAIIDFEERWLGDMYWGSKTDVSRVARVRTTPCAAWRDTFRDGVAGVVITPLLTTKPRYKTVYVQGIPPTRTAYVYKAGSRLRFVTLTHIHL